MKKFSKLNESYVDDNISVSLDITISPRVSNAIIENVLKSYPNKRLLELYGHENIISKVIQEYFKEYLIHNDSDLEYNISAMGEDWFEQLFLDDLNLPEDQMRDTMLRMNGRNPDQ